MYDSPTMPAPGEPVRADALYHRIQTRIQHLEDEAAARNQQLAVYYNAPGDAILITAIAYDSAGLMILDGLDSVKRECRVLVHASAFALTTKFLSIKSATQTAKIGFRGDATDR